MTVEKLTGAPLDWKSIDWNKVEASVKRLQMRIAKATQESRLNRVKVLQRILTRSFSAKLLAVKRVTSNKGARTPGVDNKVWNTSRQKMEAVMSLKQKGYKAKPLRRVYIPKSNGTGQRPLSIPVMKCRAMQALYKLALEPIAETTADLSSYGFRPHRSVADAIQHCFLALARKCSSQWVLEGDIASCFDKISHDFLDAKIPIERKILTKWLKAGYMEGGTTLKTEEGTPQGGIVSPTLLVMTLSGLETAIRKACSRKDKVNVIVYADDFVVTGATKEVLEKKVRPVIETFLSERGLSLSPHKTVITHIDQGFDFLGHNVRKYRGKLIIKPSKSSVKRLIGNVRKVFNSNKTAKTENVINMVNPKISGWTNFYRHFCAKKTFAYIDREIFQITWRWAKRRHAKRKLRKVKSKYYTSQGSRNWIFFAKTNQGPHVYLRRASSTKIVRHSKIKSTRNPFLAEDQDYFKSLKTRRAQMKYQEPWELAPSLRRKPVVAGLPPTGTSVKTRAV